MDEGLTIQRDRVVGSSDYGIDRVELAVDGEGRSAQLPSAREKGAAQSSRVVGGGVVSLAGVAVKWSQHLYLHVQLRATHFDPSAARGEVTAVNAGGQLSVSRFANVQQHSLE
jgi:hypothetical protein